MNIQQINAILESNSFDSMIQSLGNEDVMSEKKRIRSLLKKTEEVFQEGDYALFSSPGRSEIGGNHTDHQQGRVIAAAIQPDMMAIAKRNELHVIRIISEGFEIQPIDLNDLRIHENERHHTEALIRGIASRFHQLGYSLGGFDAVMDSRVPLGSGMSSSACFEVLCALILNEFYMQNKISPEEIAQIAQYAENEYYQKPCGLLDQMAISCGGFTYIDFLDKEKPQIEKLTFDFQKHGYGLILTQTHQDHEHLSDEYAAIFSEMKDVARSLGGEFLAHTSFKDFMMQASIISQQLKNDRAILRALHFYEENERVLKQKQAIENQNILELMQLMKASGNSSFMLLQNIYSSKTTHLQAVSLALAFSQIFLKDEGICRVHGGGFGGTIQTVVPVSLIQEYIHLMETFFGFGSSRLVNVRSSGACRIL